MTTPLNIKGKSKKELAMLLYAYQQAIDFNMLCSMTDLKGNIIYVNNKFCEISKYAEDELLGQNHNILNSNYHPKEFFKNMWKTIGKGNVWHGEVKNKAKDGTLYWVDTVVLPIYDSNQKIIQYLSLRMPINERKQIEFEKQNHMKALDEMLFMTSHKVRRPVTTCLGLMEIVEADNVSLTQKEVNSLISHFKSSAVELDEFTRELTAFISEMRQKSARNNWA
jgi:PAS domain S-box-containing protein